MIFFHFIVYRLYQLATRLEKKIPVVIVLGWLTVISFLHVCTLFSLVTIICGIDLGRVFSLSKSYSLVTVLWLVLWALGIWILLRAFGVKERAFSSDLVRVYRERGYKDSWIIAYFVGSFVAMAVTTWFAGARLRGHV